MALDTKCGRDKYHRHLESLERISQTASVDEYHHYFEELMHKVLVCNKNYDEAFFITKIVNGLKLEIQSAIRLHKPRTVDTAFSLAQTQEDLLEETKQMHHTEYKSDYKQNKGILGPAPEEKCQVLHPFELVKGMCSPLICVSSIWGVMT